MKHISNTFKSLYNDLDEQGLQIDDTVTSTMSKTMQTIMPTLHELGDCLVGSGFLLFEAVSLSIVFGTSK